MKFKLILICLKLVDLQCSQKCNFAISSILNANIRVDITVKYNNIFATPIHVKHWLEVRPTLCELNVLLLKYDSELTLESLI